MDAAHRLQVVVKLPLKQRAQVADIDRIYEPLENR
jgi:hypothetical protein